MDSKKLRAYHGSGVKIDAFDYRFTDQGDDQIGSGFYFTDDVDEAERYAFATKSGASKLGGDHEPTVHEVQLDLKRPLGSEDEGDITVEQAKRIILASPILDDALANWGDVEFEGRDELIARAAEGYAVKQGHVLKALHCLSNDFFPGPSNIEAFNRAVTRTLGYDGVVRSPGQWPTQHYVAWFPEQITVIRTWQPVGEAEITEDNSHSCGRR